MPSGIKPLIGDALLKQTKALPNGAATINSNGFDLGAQSGLQAFLANLELRISVPALATGVLGDAATIKYSVQHDDAAGFGTAVTIAADILTQTGAGGAGAPAAEVRFRLPTDVKRYVRVRAVKSAIGDASGSVLTEELLF